MCRQTDLVFLYQHGIRRWVCVVAVAGVGWAGIILVLNISIFFNLI
jgi:hypothetical protein